MKTSHLAALVVTLALLQSGCGGGGGNPGTCTASEETCAAQGNGNTSGSAGGVANSTSDTTSTSSTATDPAVCSQFLDQSAAQQYLFTHPTATQLDPDGDGVACNN